MPATGKHFPGHGGVSADSHQTLPIDQRDSQAIHANDLVPFQRLSRSLDAIMPAHVVFAAFDAKPASFSRYWLQDVLRKQLGFEGIIISYDLSMSGAAVMGDHLDRAIHALEAGCDLLTICNNREGAVAVIDGLRSYRNTESRDRISAFLSKIQPSEKSV